MKKIYIAGLLIVVVLCSAGIYAINSGWETNDSNDIIKTNNAPANSSSLDLKDNLTSSVDKAISLLKDDESASNVLSHVVNDVSVTRSSLGMNNTDVSINDKNVSNDSSDSDVKPIYRPRNIKFTEDDIGVLYIDDNGELYVYYGNRDTTVWGKPGEPDVFVPELNGGFTDKDLPQPPILNGGVVGPVYEVDESGDMHQVL